LNIGLDLDDLERQLLEHVVSELDGGLLVELAVNLQHPQACAVVDGGVLIVLGPNPADRLDELDVDLDRVAGQLLLVALPALFVPLVALRGGQAAEVEAPQDPPDVRLANRDLVPGATQKSGWLRGHSAGSRRRTGRPGTGVG